MRVRWVKVWVDSLATLTERFRDEEGRVDFEALGREEYAFRHAIVTGDFSRSERARDIYEATLSEITARSEAGRKSAEARRNKKNTAAATTSDGVDVVPDRESGSLVRTNGCNPLTADAPHREAGDERQHPSDGELLESGTSANNMRRVPQNEAPAHGFSGGRTAQGTMSRSPEAAAQSGKDYDQEALDKPTISANSPAGAGVNLDSTQTNKRPDASDGNAEGVVTNGSTTSKNGSRAVCTFAPSGQTIEAPLRPGAGEVPPESVLSAPSPALPVPAKRPHGEFGNVLLTDDEFRKLCEKCPDADELITELDQYIESQGKTKKYKSHYATLLNWSRRKAQEAKPKQGYMTSDDISKKNYQESKARLEAMFSGGRKTA